MSSPTSSEQVANVQRAYLAARMQERKQMLTRALAEAAERAGLPPPRVSFPSSPDAPPGEMRVRFPTLPPEVMPSSPAIEALPQAVPAVGPPPGPRPPRLRASHAVLVVLMTLVTLAVWSLVVRVYLRAGAHHPGEPGERSGAPHAG